MNTTELSLDYKKDNPRSSITISGHHFIKTSSELDLEREADELKRLKTIDTGTPHIHVPEILGFDRSTNALTTRYIEASQSLYNLIWNGTSLIGLIKGKTLDRETLFQRMDELGKWLKGYHASSMDACTAHDPSGQLIAIFNEKADLIRRMGLIKGQLLDKIKSHYLPILEKMSDKRYLDAHHIRICRIHGDFNASNMLVDDGMNIHILDFADTRIGFCHEDLVRFYELIWTIGRASLIHHKTLSGSLNIFLRSYGLPQSCETSPVFSSIFALNALIGCITEATTKEFNPGQLLTQLEYKLITWLSMRRVISEVSR